MKGVERGIAEERAEGSQAACAIERDMLIALVDSVSRVHDQLSLVPADSLSRHRLTSEHR